MLHNLPSSSHNCQYLANSYSIATILTLAGIATSNNPNPLVIINYKMSDVLAEIMGPVQRSKSQRILIPFLLQLILIDMAMACHEMDCKMII